MMPCLAFYMDLNSGCGTNVLKCWSHSYTTEDVKEDDFHEAWVGKKKQHILEALLIISEVSFPSDLR